MATNDTAPSNRVGANPANPHTRIELIRWLLGWTQIAGDRARPLRRLTFASNFDLAASFAFRAVAAASARCAGGIASVAARCGGVALAADSAASVARGTISVAWRITIDADMGGHGAPPT